MRLEKLMKGRPVAIRWQTSDVSSPAMGSVSPCPHLFPAVCVESVVCMVVDVFVYVEALYADYPS